VKITIAKKNTLHGAKLKLPLIIRTKVRPNRTPKGAKKRVIWWSFEQEFSRSFILNNFAWQVIDEINRREKSFVPIFKRHRSMCQKKKTDFNYMTMLTCSAPPFEKGRIPFKKI
jgi:hypothetical protein